MATTSTNNKLDQAMIHIRAAEKSLKTSVFKWRPEFDVACDEYQQAATIYRTIKQYDLCREVLMKAAECHLQNRSLFHAAKCFDQAILVMKEQNQLGEIEALAHRACKLYQQQGSPEAGASSLEKAAKIVEQTLPEHALNLYQHAVEVVTLEDHSRQGAEYASKVSRILVRLQRFDQAADALRREICLNQETDSFQVIGRLAVALVLVQLAREDSVAAEKAFKEWGNCCDQNEVQTLEMLLQAYDEEDPETAKRALSSPFIMHMDVEYARLARDLPLPKGMAALPTKKPAPADNSAPEDAIGGASGAGGAVGGIMGDDEDEDDGGLC